MSASTRRSNGSATYATSDNEARDLCADKHGADHLEYQPDFVAETTDAIHMLEPKAKSELNDPIVLAKRDAAVKWCERASTHADSYNGKRWRYALIPHDEINENISLQHLAKRFVISKALDVDRV